MNTKKDKIQLKTEALMHQLLLIEEVNREIEISQKMNSNLMVKQALKMKKEFTQELLNILAEYNLPVQLSEAA